MMKDHCIIRAGFLLQAKEYLHIWPSRKNFINERLLLNTYLMLDLLYKTVFPFITTAVDNSKL